MLFFTQNYHVKAEQLEPTKNGLLEGFKKVNQVRMLGLESLEDAKALVNKFPKYVKVKPYKSGSLNGFSEYGIYSDSNNKAYGIEIVIAGTNGVTGEANEAGEKRINKFIEVLQNENLIK